MNNEFRRILKPTRNNEEKHYYNICNEYSNSERVGQIITDAIVTHLAINNGNTFHCSERSLFEFFMYLAWLVGDGYSLTIRVEEFESENDFREGKQRDFFYLVRERTSEGVKTGIRRYLNDGSLTLTFKELNLEPYERKYIIESWECRD
jgi:hypothetical protein